MHRFWLGAASNEFVDSHAKTTIAHLPAVRLRQLEIALPSLAEQKRITKILRDQMDSVEATRAAAKAQLKSIETIIQATLAQEFSAKSTERWLRCSLGELCDVLARQVDPTLLEYRDLPHVNGERIESGTGRLLELNSACEDGMTSGKYLFEAGCVLYSKLRPYLRKVTYANFNGLCSADMYPIVTDANKLLPEFLCWLLLSPGFSKYAESESQRSRMPKLNREQLFSYQAEFPTYTEQARIVHKLSEVSKATSTATSACKKQLTAINALPASILRQAFSGQL